MSSPDEDCSGCCYTLDVTLAGITGDWAFLNGMTFSLVKYGGAGCEWVTRCDTKIGLCADSHYRAKCLIWDDDEGYLWGAEAGSVYSEDDLRPYVLLSFVRVDTGSCWIGSYQDFAFAGTDDPQETCPEDVTFSADLYGSGATITVECGV